jgi:hypothetical protein
MKTARRRVDVNLDELDGARQAPLSEDDYEKLKEALHALAAMLVRPRNTVERGSAPILELRDHRRRGLVVFFRTYSFRLLCGIYLSTCTATQPSSVRASRRWPPAAPAL